jgi:nicotinamidase-related amidase
MPSPLHVADTVPYPWPYDGLLRPDRTALVVCGAQTLIVTAARDADGVRERLIELAAGVRASGGTVIWVRHGAGAHRSRPTQFLPVIDSTDWQLVEDPDPSDAIVDSRGWDGCFGSALDHTLRSRHIATVLLGGFASEITVDSTVRTLNDQGHECLVLTDGCAPLDTDLGARAHHSLTMSGGIFGALGTITAAHDALRSATPSPTDHLSPIIARGDLP